MTISRRNLLRVAAAAPLAPILATPSIVRAKDLKHLVVAEPIHSTGYLPLYVAVHKGMFAAQGLDVKVVTLDSGGAAHTNAVLSGQAFAFIGGPEHCAYAKAKGGELRSVANVVNRGNVYFMAREGVKVDKDLHKFFKGRAIATGFYGGTPNSITRYVVIKKAGLKLTDAKMIESTGGGDLAIVKAGRADIGIATEPLITKGVVQKIWQEPFYNVPKELGPYAYSCLNVGLDSIKKDPKLVRAFVRAVMEGLKVTHEKRAEAEEVAHIEFPTMSEADVKVTLDRSYADEIWSKDGTISRQAWHTARDVVMTAGLLKEKVSYDAIIDMQFVS